MAFLRRLFQGAAESGQVVGHVSGPQSVAPRQAQTLIEADQPPFLLDVREPHEYSAGHIARARLIPLGELGARINELPKEQPILCICRSGSRSGVAARQLSAHGFQTINLSGGMIAWAGAGLPVKRGNGK